MPSSETTPSTGTSTARPHPRAAFSLGPSLPAACHSLLPPSEDARSPSPCSVDSSFHIALSTALGVINCKLIARGNFQFGYIYFPKDTDYIPRNTSTGAPYQTHLRAAKGSYVYNCDAACFWLLQAARGTSYPSRKVISAAGVLSKGDTYLRGIANRS